MSAEPDWGVDSEYGRLLDVLLCPPDHFRWLPTSAISRATLASDLVFSREDAVKQHAEMVSVYEDNGVNVHLLEPDPHLPYQVFARDSSINVPQRPDHHPARPVLAPGRVRAHDPLLPATTASRSPRWSPRAPSRAATS